MSTRATSTAIAIAVVVVPLLAACGSAAAPHATRTSPTHTAAAVPAGDNGNLIHPVGAISALSGFKCTADGTGRWSASGVVSNTAPLSSRYVLDITVIEKKVDTVVGSVHKQFTVKGGHRVEIKAPNFYTSRKSNLECLPRLVRGTSK